MTLISKARRMLACTGLLATLLALPIDPAQAQTWLLDSFEPGTVGLAPGDPEVGSVYRACTTGVTCDNYTVVQLGGRKMVHFAGDQGGAGLQWFLDGGGPLGNVDYQFTLLPGGAMTGANAFNLGLVLTAGSLGAQVQLMVGDVGSTQLQSQYIVYQPGAGGGVTRTLPFTVRRGQELAVRWHFDAQLDTLALSIDGQPVDQTRFDGPGIDGVISTYAVSNFASTFSWVVDEVSARAAPVPEPASLGLWALGLLFTGIRLSAIRATA